MSSKEYIQQAIDGQYLSIPIKYKKPSRLPATTINALRKQYAQYRKATGSEIHTASKRFLFHDQDLKVDVEFIRFQNIEYILINEVYSKDEKEECITYVESGRLTYIGFYINYANFNKHSLLEYSDDVAAWVSSNPTEPWCGEVKNVTY